jgi:hypothetical protein
MQNFEKNLDVFMAISFYALQVKIEKYYVPKFETFVRMPSFHFSTDEYIEAEVESEFTFDKKGFGDCIFR